MGCGSGMHTRAGKKPRTTASSRSDSTPKTGDRQYVVTNDVRRRLISADRSAGLIRNPNFYRRAAVLAGRSNTVLY